MFLERMHCVRGYTSSPYLPVCPQGPSVAHLVMHKSGQGVVVFSDSNFSLVSDTKKKKIKPRETFSQPYSSFLTFFLVVATGPLIQVLCANILVHVLICECVHSRSRELTHAHTHTHTHIHARSLNQPASLGNQGFM